MGSKTWMTFLALLWVLSATAQNNTGVRFDSSASQLLFYEIQQVNRVNDDSAVILIRAGKADGLFSGSEGYVFTSHNSGAGDKRESAEYIANVKLIQLSDSNALCAVKLYSQYRQYPILKRDLVGLSTYLVQNAVPNLFSELAGKEIQFLDNYRKPVMTKSELLFNRDNGLEETLLKRYQKEINDFYEDILEYKDSVFVTPYKRGPFKGLTMQQVFQKTTTSDLRSFFQFVSSYPGKYMGNQWKINETYATWVLNNAPQGDGNREWLLDILVRTESGELNQYLVRHRFYIQNDSLAGWTDRIEKLQSAGKTEEALSLGKKLIYLAQQLRDRDAENGFYYQLSIASDAMGNKKDALLFAKKAYDYDPENINYAYQLASRYGGLEQFDSSFALYEKLLKRLPGNSNIMGNYGWYRILAGQAEAAVPLCRAAYQGDSSSVAFTVNYGHTFLLRNQPDSARYYYQKTLDNLQTPEEYQEGPKSDMDLFFKKGWARKSVAEMADWMDTRFREKYAAITRGNVIWGKARAAYDKKQYGQAARLWQQYIEIFRGHPEPPLTSLHNALNWTGVSYSAAGMKDSARYYYQQALRLAQDELAALRNSQTNRDNDPVVNDYERLYNFFSRHDMAEQAEQYRLLYEAEYQKVSELFANPALHLLALHAPDRGKDKTNEAGAALLYPRLLQCRTEGQPEGITRLLKGDLLTREKLLQHLEDLRKKSKPEDIFIFYYAGNFLQEAGETYLDFNPADSRQGRIGIQEFMDNLDLVYAHKKMLITDKPATPLLTQVASRYTRAGKNAPEIILLCPGVETPMQADGASLFTTQLAATLTELQHTEQFSAKDLADKAAYRLGRGQYYFPALSFSFGKDFLLKESRNAPRRTAGTGTVSLSRGVDPSTAEDSPESLAIGPQKNYALLFATDVYRDPGFTKLANPIYDAETLGKLLREEFGFEVTIVKNPTLDQMESRLSDFRDNKVYGPNDQLFLFFAGHGLYFEKIKMGFLVAADSKINDPNFRSYLSYSDLGSKYLKNINCKRIFLALDACFAGSFFDNAALRGSPDEMNAKNLLNLKRMAAGQHFYKGISSGAKQYVEDGKPGQHSPFASRLLEVLWNRTLQKNFVTADEIIGELKSNPPAATAVCEGKFHYSDPFSHFIFELKNTRKQSDIRKSEAVSPNAIGGSGK